MPWPTLDLDKHRLLENRLVTQQAYRIDWIRGRGGHSQIAVSAVVSAPSRLFTMVCDLSHSLPVDSQSRELSGTRLSGSTCDRFCQTRAAVTLSHPGHTQAALEMQFDGEVNLKRPACARQARDASYRFGPTRFSVIPRVAVGNVSIRFVPDQDADKLIDLLRHDLASVHTPHPALTIKTNRVP